MHDPGVPPAEMDPFPEVVGDEDYLSELVAHHMLYLVSPDKFDREMLKLTLSSLFWSGIAIGCVLITVSDNVSISKGSSHIEYHWMSLLVMGAVVATFESILIFWKRDLL